MMSFISRLRVYQCAHKLIRRYGGAKVAFVVLLCATALLYAVNLTKSEYGNDYYAAAAQAGAHSWKSFLYGGLDFPPTITVDKPPASLWLSSLGIRLFGLSSWTILYPQVLYCLASMWLTYILINRYFGAKIAWLASFFLAITPLIYAMDRFNNPEALMILFMLAMAVAIDNALRLTHTTPAAGNTKPTGNSGGAGSSSGLSSGGAGSSEGDASSGGVVNSGDASSAGSSGGGAVAKWGIKNNPITVRFYRFACRLNTPNGWMFFAGLLAGGAFLTKQLEALMSLPALVITILIYYSSSWYKKIAALLWALLGLIVGAGWWVALVECIPSSRRPYIGGSPTNDFLELTFGYNGLTRVLGTSFKNLPLGQSTSNYYPYLEKKSGEYEGEGFWWNGSNPGIKRFFYSTDAAQINWLLCIAIVAILIFSWYCWIQPFFQRITRRFSNPSRASKIPGCIRQIVQKISHLPSSPMPERNSIAPRDYFPYRSTWGQRATLLNWTLTLLTIFPFMSFMGETYHAYYPVIMAPAIAILAAIMMGYVWEHLSTPPAKIILSILIILVGIQYFANFHLEDDYLHTLQYWAIGASIVGLLIIIVYWAKPRKWLKKFATGASVIIIANGPIIYDISTATAMYPGMPVAGPNPFHMNIQTVKEIMLQTTLLNKNLLNLKPYLLKDASHYIWAVAIIGSFDSARLQLILDYSVMPIGGFMGIDKNLSLEQFKNYIVKHEIHYFYIEGAPDADSSDYPVYKDLVQYVIDTFPVTKFLIKDFPDQKDASIFLYNLDPLVPTGTSGGR